MIDYQLFVLKRELVELNAQAAMFADAPDEIWHEFICDVQELERKIRDREVEILEAKAKVE